MISKKPILVTGSHRSGTTWVGKMLSVSPAVAYIHEPFNLDWHQSRPGICSASFQHWFTYITEENETIFYKPIKNMLEFRYNLITDIRTSRSLKKFAQISRDYTRNISYRLRNPAPLIKDPIAIFSAEWLVSKFNMNIILLIRHPAAFASSLKIKNWKFQFSNFLQQDLLMKDHLHPFEHEIRNYTEKEHDIIDQAALLWKIIHYMILHYKKNHPDWFFIRHEDLSRDPLGGFSILYNNLNLKFSKHIREEIIKYSNPRNPRESFKGKDSIKRNTKANIWSWKNRLTATEIGRIRSQTESISQIFYSDKDW